MAFSIVSRVLHGPYKNLLFCRCLGYYSNKNNFSVQASEYSQNEENKPLKYIASDASKITISENIFGKTNKSMNWPKHIILMGSLAVFMLYFCVLREENDIDEMIKGNEKYQSDYIVLSNLTLKLGYCKANNLPTQKLEKQIDELKEKLGITNY